MEAQYIHDRAQLRDLMSAHPTWTQKQMAITIGRSVKWVQKWLKRLRASPPGNDEVLRSHSRARRTPPEKIASEVVRAILEIRDNPPQNLQRTPGPLAIRYYLEHDTHLKTAGFPLPRSTRTIWKILDEAGRIYRPTPVVHEPWAVVEPLAEWQLDFKDASTVPADPEGKRQHVIEVFNVVDKGTSLLLDALPREDYTAETVILAMTNTLLIHGLPDKITFDRDGRFVGSNTGSGDFPSAFVRFLLCLGIQPDICPPRRPDRNAFVERYHLSYETECLQVQRPTSLEQVREVTQNYQEHYNHERPHQGRSCGNRPPYIAFPALPRRPRLPDRVALDGWVAHVDHRLYRRHIARGGYVQLGRHGYYVQKALQGREVVLRVQASERTLAMLIDEKLFKTVPLKGLRHEEVEFDTFLRLMCQEAVSEYQLYQKRALRWVAA